MNHPSSTSAAPRSGNGSGQPVAVRTAMPQHRDHVLCHRNVLLVRDSDSRRSLHHRCVGLQVQLAEAFPKSLR